MSCVLDFIYNTQFLNVKNYTYFMQNTMLSLIGDIRKQYLIVAIKKFMKFMIYLGG